MSLNLTPKLIGEGKALGRITETLYGFDHFDGKFIDPADAASPWNNIETGSGDGPAEVADERGGVVSITPDSTDDAVGGYAYERNWAPVQQGGRMIMEVKFKFNTAITGAYAFIGWNDDSATAERPIILAASAAYGTVVAGDHAGVVFHTLGNATNAYLVATLNGVNVGTPIAIPGFTMVADRWAIFRCEIDGLGNVFGAGGMDTDAAAEKTDKDFDEVGHLLGVTPATNMCPYVVFGDLAAGNQVSEIDYIYFGGNIDATAA